KPGFRAFVKIVRPRRIQALQARHALLAPILRVPKSHGWSEEHGLVVLEALPGLTLREALATPGTDVPTPAALFALLDEIPDPGDGVRHVSTVKALPQHAALIRKLLPEHVALVDQITEGAQRATPAETLVPVHGDYYEAQVL